MRQAGFLFAFAFTLSCSGDYARTNPYDPKVPVQVTVLGPDTLFSYSEIASFGARTVPQFPDTAIVFGTTDSVAFFPSGYGSFSSKLPPLYPLTRSVGVYALIGQLDTVFTTQVFPPVDLAHANPPPPPPTPGLPTFIWRHSGYKTVVLTQRVVRIQLRCPNTSACDTISAGAQWTVWADGFDALNQPVASLTGANANPSVSDANPIFATFAVRDTTIASVSPVGIRVATVIAKKLGSTWIVASRGSLLDSLRLTVR